MKKQIFTLLALVAFALTANAQFVVGGTFGIAHDGSKTDDTYNNSSTSYTINPRLGYQLNDRMQAGLLLGYSYNYNRNYYTLLGDTYYNSNQNSTFGFAPYFRYNFINHDRLNFYMEASLAFDFMGKGSNYNSQTNTTTDGVTKASTYALRIVPGVNYALTDNLSMDVNFDILSCALGMAKVENTATNTTTNYHDYHLTNLSTGAGQVISFGFAYTF